MTLTTGMREAISQAVSRAGGDVSDADDLAWVWERLEHDWGPRVDAMRREAQTVRCSCADGGVGSAGGRCQRCYGKVDP